MLDAPQQMARRSSYIGPTDVETIGLWTLLDGVREIPARQRGRLALPGLGEVAPGADVDEGPTLYYSGDRSLVRRPCVAVVGARKVSPEGAARARRIARELVHAGVVVVSGLAEGVDTNAHKEAIAAGGRTIGVIGTPLEKSYPAFNAELQECIYRDHLLVSQYATGAPVFKSNFPQRNKVMAAISDATIIVEANDDSGSLHQAAECAPNRLNRWLFIARSIIEESSATWPQRFLGKGKVGVLTSIDDVLAVLPRQ